MEEEEEKRSVAGEMRLQKKSEPCGDDITENDVKNESTNSTLEERQKKLQEFKLSSTGEEGSGERKKRDESSQTKGIFSD